MATTWYTAESGTVGAQVVAADNAAHVPATDVGQAATCATGATMTFVADPMHGSKAVKITSAGALSWVRLNATGFSSYSGAATIYAKWDTAATQDNTILAVLASGTKAFYLNRQGTNKWRVTDQASSAAWTSTSSVPLNAYVRIEAAWTISSTASASGTLNLAIYDGDTNNLLEPEQTLTLSLGTAPATAVYTGKYDTGTYAGSLTIDSYGFSDTATTRLGKYPAVVPTVTAVVSPASADTGVLRTLTLTLTNGNGNAVTWGPVTWEGTTDPAVATAAGVNSKTFTRTPTVAGAGKSGSYSWSQA